MGIAPTAVSFEAPMKTCSACVACHVRKLKCVIPTGSQSCQSCSDRGIFCERRIARKRGRPRLHGRSYQSPWGVQSAPPAMSSLPAMVCHTVVIGSPAAPYAASAYPGPRVCAAAPPGYATLAPAASHAVIPAGCWPAESSMLPTHYISTPHYAHAPPHAQLARPPPHSVAMYEASAPPGGAAPPSHVRHAYARATPSAYEPTSLPAPFSTTASQPGASHAANADPAATMLLSLSSHGASGEAA